MTKFRDMIKGLSSAMLAGPYLSKFHHDCIEDNIQRDNLMQRLKSWVGQKAAFDFLEVVTKESYAQTSSNTQFINMRLELEIQKHKIEQLNKLLDVAIDL